jgi:CheY-like chemotaxis protein
MHMPRQKILIVDDERVISDSLAVILEKAGYQTRAVYSAEQALETISGWTPDLAILDVVLPSMTGIDLAILLKSSHPTIAVMLISGQIATGGLIEKAAQLGHQFDVHSKPVPIPDFLAHASQLLA